MYVQLQGYGYFDCDSQVAVLLRALHRMRAEYERSPKAHKFADCPPAGECWVEVERLARTFLPSELADAILAGGKLKLSMRCLTTQEVYAPLWFKDRGTVTLLEPPRKPNPWTRQRHEPA
jgi:hypothetical protein